MNYIYKITNLINGKYYIGKRHQRKEDNPLTDGYWGSGVLIKKAIEKYGLNNFKKEIIEVCDTMDELNKREEEIVNLDIVNDPMSYNLQCGGDIGGSQGRKLSSDTIEKIRKGNLGKKWSYTQRLKYEETLQEFSKENDGKRCSKETSKRMSEARKGKSSYWNIGREPWNKGKKLPQCSAEKSGMFGYIWSDEQKMKISNSLKGRHLSTETKLKLSENNIGRHWWTNGIDNLFQYESPGEEWVRGRLLNK